MAGEARSASPGAADRPVLLWVTNFGAAEITANSVASVGKAGFADRYRLLLVHTDDQARDLIAGLWLGAELLPVGALSKGPDPSPALPRDYHDYGTQPFRHMSFLKYVAIRYALATYRRRTIYVDGDIVFLKDPALYFDGEPLLRDGCVWAQNDGKLDFFKDKMRRPYGPGTFPEQSRICAGFTVWSPRRAHMKLAESVARHMMTPGGLEDDQKAFNRLTPGVRDRVQLLPLDRFCFDLAEGERAIRDALDPILIHANWMIGVGTKTRALKEAGLWFL